MKSKPLNDYIIRIRREVLVKASGPLEAFQEAQDVGEYDWDIEDYAAECCQCHEIYDYSDRNLDHDCPILKSK